MAKSMNKIAKWIFMLVGVIVSVAIGGSFVAGKYTDVMILKILPMLVHQVVGWIIVVVALVGLGLSIIDELG